MSGASPPKRHAERVARVLLRPSLRVFAAPVIRAGLREVARGPWRIPAALALLVRRADLHLGTLAGRPAVFDPLRELRPPGASRTCRSVHGDTLLRGGSRGRRRASAGTGHPRPVDETSSREGTLHPPPRAIRAARRQRCSSGLAGRRRGAGRRRRSAGRRRRSAGHDVRRRVARPTAHPMARTCRWMCFQAYVS